MIDDLHQLGQTPEYFTPTVIAAAQECHPYDINSKLKQKEDCDWKNNDMESEIVLGAAVFKVPFATYLTKLARSVIAE